MEGVPFETCHLSALFLIGPHTLPPQLAFLVGVLLTRAAFYHGVEFLFDHLAACNVHLSAPPISVGTHRGPCCCGRSASGRSPTPQNPTANHRLDRSDRPELAYLQGFLPGRSLKCHRPETVSRPLSSSRMNLRL